MAFHNDKWTRNSALKMTNDNPNSAGSHTCILIIFTMKPELVAVDIFIRFSRGDILYIRTLIFYIIYKKWVVTDIQTLLAVRSICVTKSWP